MRTLIAVYIALQSIVAQGGCPEALDACGKLVEAQDGALKHRQEDIQRLQEAAIDGSKRPIVPFWVMLVASVATFGAGAALSVPVLIALGGGMGIGAVTVGIKE